MKNFHLQDTYHAFTELCSAQVKGIGLNHITVECNPLQVESLHISFFFSTLLGGKKSTCPTKAHKECYKPNVITKVGTIPGNPEEREILLFFGKILLQRNSKIDIDLTYFNTIQTKLYLLNIKHLDIVYNVSVME